MVVVGFIAHLIGTRAQLAPLLPFNQTLSPDPLPSDSSTPALQISGCEIRALRTESRDPKSGANVAGGQPLSLGPVLAAC